MSLAQTILASRLLTTALLLEPPVWPIGTVLVPDDVRIGGRSLAAQAQSATPAVRIGEGEHAAGTPQRFVSVVLTRVLDCVTEEGAGRRSHRVVTVDADIAVLSGPQEALHVAAARIIGRRTPGRTGAADLRGRGSTCFVRSRLPRDLRVGDVLAIPCEGVIPVSAVRCPELAEDDDPAEPPSCPRHTA